MQAGMACMYVWFEFFFSFFESNLKAREKDALCLSVWMGWDPMLNRRVEWMDGCEIRQTSANRKMNVSASIHPFFFIHTRICLSTWHHQHAVRLTVAKRHTNCSRRQPPRVIVDLYDS